MASDAGQRFLWVGNAPWLDLVNTRPMSGGVRVDLLASPADVAAWLAEAGLLDAAAARRAESAWSGRAGTAALGAVHGVRAALEDVADAAMDGRPAPRRALDVLNAFMAEHPPTRRLVAGAEGIAARAHAGANDPLSALSLVVESMAATLAAGGGARVRQCEGLACVLRFLDASRNGARRWCSMASCGNRAKVAAHYERAKRGSSAASTTRAV